MKNIRAIAIFLLALICISSCQPSPESGNSPQYGDNSSNRGKEGEYLVAVSRLRSIRNNSRSFDEDGEWEEGAKIVGVLLKFHDGNETTMDENGYIKNDPYAFYIEELDKIRQNGDGMSYNYILYIPSVIRNVYRDANGKNPDSGNPFW